MLGRSIGIEEEKLRHLGDDPLPDGVYSDAEAAIIRYAQRSTRMLSIDETTYQALARHFSVPQLTRAKPCPYKKDDNAHIEQKNWIHVRKLLGFDGRPVGPGEMDTEISPGYDLRRPVRGPVPVRRLTTCPRHSRTKTRRPRMRPTRCRPARASFRSRPPGWRDFGASWPA